MYQQNNKQNFLESAAKSLYGDRRKKEKEEKSLRNSLLNELGDNLTPAHILYSSNEELKKIRDEMNAKKLQQKAQNNFNGNFLGAASSIDEAQDSLQVPLPGNGKEQQNPPIKNDNTKEIEIDLTHKPKLFGKIPVEKRVQQNSHAPRQEENRDFQGLDYATGDEVYEMEPIKGSVSLNQDKDEPETQNDKNIGNNLDKEETSRQSKIDDAKFNELMKHVYKTEGGYSNRKNDRGGKTNYGITQATYDAYNKKHGLPLKDVRQITYDEADKIYYNEYYKASGADKIEDKNLSYMHFDSAINHGVGGAGRLLKQSGGTFDGYYNARKNKYKNIVENDPTQQENLNGWMNRIDRIKKMRDENLL